MEKIKNSKSAAIAGGVTGGATAAGIGVAAAGSSAATITYTLGAVGALVGGGMAAGLAIVAATPLAIGGAAYGITKIITRKKHK